MLYEATNLYSEEAPTIARPKIKHLAFVSRYPDKLAKFYEDVFGMDILNRSEGLHGMPPSK